MEAGEGRGKALSGSRGLVSNPGCVATKWSDFGGGNNISRTAAVVRMS